MSKVLITGTTGFVGSNLVKNLVENGYNAYSFERYVTGRYVLGGTRIIKTVFGDLRDSFSIKKCLREVQPDIVIHLAAISPVSYSYEHPNEVMDTNLIGTINLAEACLREIPHFKQFLFASTSETYGNGPSPKSEDTQQNPNSPYAVSKLACEKYLKYMEAAYNFPITILRNFNTYGRKNNAHFIVERAITQMIQENIIKLGDPTPIRDFMYVEDHVNSYLSCLENNKAMGHIFNFCIGEGISIKQLVETIGKLLDFKGKILWHTIPPRPLGIKILIGNYSKAKKILGWEPHFSLEEGLKLSIKFWKNKLSSSKSS